MGDSSRTGQRANPGLGLLSPHLATGLSPGQLREQRLAATSGLSLGQNIGRLGHQLAISGLDLLHHHSLGARDRAGAPNGAEAGLDGAHSIAEAGAGESPVGWAQSSWSGARDRGSHMSHESHVSTGEGRAPYLTATDGEAGPDLTV